MAVVREQVAAGIDVPTDGEIRRERSGFLLTNAGTFLGLILAGSLGGKCGVVSWTAEVPTVTGKIRSGRPILVRDWRLAQSATDRPVKMSLPGPLTIIELDGK